MKRESHGTINGGGKEGRKEGDDSGESIQ